MTAPPDSAGGPRIMVVGLGNPDRGDDGVGARVVKLLAGRLPPEVGLQTRSGDLLALVEDWRGVDHLICVDAAAPMGAPGRIHRLDADVDELPREPGLASSHAFGLVEAIALARALGSAPAQIIVYAIEGADFDTGAAMTEAVMAAIGDVADRVVAEVNRLRLASPGSASHA